MATSRTGENEEEEGGHANENARPPSSNKLLADNNNNNNTTTAPTTSDDNIMFVNADNQNITDENNDDPANLRNALDAMSNQDYDSAVQRYQDEICAEISEQPRVSSREDFGRLLGEYINDDLFRNKLLSLSERYSLIRRTRGDGNCFYRAFGFRLCELLATDQRYASWRPKIKQTFQDCKTSLIEKGYPQFSVEDFCQSAVETLDKVIQHPDQLEPAFQCAEESDYFVVFLRLLTALALMEMEETFQPFLEALGYPQVSDFCRAEVEPMNKDTDQPQIMALAQILGVCIRIEYVDRNPGEPTSVIIPEESAPESQQHIFLLYRPGHYDILYPTSSSSSLSTR